MATTSEDRARTLGRKHAVTGVPRQDQDDSGRTRLLAALGYRGTLTGRGWPWRWRALEAYGEAYDRAAQWAAGDPDALVPPGEARQWARWRDEAAGRLDSDGTFTEDDRGNWHEVQT